MTKCSTDTSKSDMPTYAVKDMPVYSCFESNNILYCKLPEKNESDGEELIMQLTGESAFSAKYRTAKFKNKTFHIVNRLVMTAYYHALEDEE